MLIRFDVFMSDVCVCVCFLSQIVDIIFRGPDSSNRKVT